MNTVKLILKRTKMCGFLRVRIRRPNMKMMLLMKFMCLVVITVVVLDVAIYTRDQIPYPYNTYKGYPLTIYEHPYHINTNQTCRNKTNLNMIIVIHSKSTHFQKRLSIRQTWANKDLLSYFGMKVVFFLGMSPREDVQTLIQKESLKHRDIVQGNFHESYTNLTHKAVLWIRWIKEYCPNAIYVLKLDDDVLVNLLAIYQTFIPAHRNDSKTIWCDTTPVGALLIPRHRGNRHRVANDELKGLVFFPLILCKGFFVIMTQDIIKPLYEAARTTPFFWIDDYYVFGELADKAHAKHIPLFSSITRDEKVAFRCFEPQQRQCLMYGSLLQSENAMEKLWELVINNDGYVIM